MHREAILCGLLLLNFVSVARQSAKTTIADQSENRCDFSSSVTLERNARRPPRLACSHMQEGVKIGNMHSESFRYEH